MEDFAVAARVRPFNEIEKAIEAKRIVEYDKKKSRLEVSYVNEEGKPKTAKLPMDHIFWAAEGKEGGNDDINSLIGNHMIDTIMNGYSASFIAYGPKGSGKSHTIVGSGSDIGLRPYVLEKVFDQIEEKTNDDVEFKVHMQYYDIYDNKVNDLLNPASLTKDGLPVQILGKTHVYATNMTRPRVLDYNEASAFIEQGIAAQALISTRAMRKTELTHTVLVMTVACSTKDFERSLIETTTSFLTFADLGSSTCEACSNGIATVIEKLLKRVKTGKRIHIPYENYPLTTLLRESIGGDCKTVLMAHLGPADDAKHIIDTVRLVSDAGQIENKPTHNLGEHQRVRNTLEKSIKQLRHVLCVDDDDDEDGRNSPEMPDGLNKIQRQAFIEHKETLKSHLTEMAMLFMEEEEELKESASLLTALTKYVSPQTKLPDDADIKSMPHLINLHHDWVLTESVIWFLPPHETIRVGRSDMDPEPSANDMILLGLRIRPFHATLLNTDGIVTLEPMVPATVYVNGELLNEARVLVHGDRVLIGLTHAFKFINPADSAQLTNNEVDVREVNFKYLIKERYFKQLGSLMESEEILVQRLEKHAQHLSASSDRASAEFDTVVFERDDLKKEYDAKRNQILSPLDQEMAKLKSDLEGFGGENANVEASIRDLQENIDECSAQIDGEFLDDLKELERKVKKAEERMNSIQNTINDLETSDHEEHVYRIATLQTLLQLFPVLDQVNAISSELRQPSRFLLRMESFKCKNQQRMDIKVRGTDNNQEIEVLIPLDDFHKKAEAMCRIYSNLHLFGVHELDVIDDHDNPFHINSDEAHLIGNARVYLQQLYFLLPISETTPIFDYKGDKMGELVIEIKPEPLESKPFDDEGVLFREEEMTELEGQALKVHIWMKRMEGIPTNSSGRTYLVYKFVGDEEDIVTDTMVGHSINPQTNHKRTVVFDPLSASVIEECKSGLLEIQVWGESPKEEEYHLSPDEVQDIHEGLQRMAHLVSGAEADNKDDDQSRSRTSAMKSPREIVTKVEEILSSDVTQTALTLKQEKQQLLEEKRALEQKLADSNIEEFSDLEKKYSKVKKDKSKYEDKMKKELKKLKAQIQENESELKIARAKANPDADPKALAVLRLEKRDMEKEQAELQQELEKVKKQLEEEKTKSSACVIL